MEILCALGPFTVIPKGPYNFAQMNAGPGLVLIVSFLGLVGCSSPLAPTALPGSALPETPERSGSTQFGRDSTPPTGTLAPRIVPNPAPTMKMLFVATPNAAPTPALLLCSPLVLHPLEELPQIISDPYNPPRPGREERHHGVDFAYYHWGERDSMQGETVQSVLPGVVASVVKDRTPYGNMVMIETPLSDFPGDVHKKLNYAPEESLYVLYAHLNTAPLVSLGEQVQACQPLGEVGMSGNTDIPHLHLETRLGPAGAVFKSMVFYDTRAKLEEMDAYRLWRTSGVFRHFDPMILLSTP